MPLLVSMLTALALTLALELTFALFWGLRKQELLLVALMNILTNPAVNLLYFFAVSLCGLPVLPIVIMLEAAVFVTEGFCCRDVIRRPWLFSLCVNGFSYAMGELLKYVI